MKKEKSLVEFASHANFLTEKIIASGGELTPEIENELTVVELGMMEKVDKYSFVMERLKLEQEYWKNKSNEFLRIAQACAGAEKKLKGALKEAMRLNNSDQIEGVNYRFKLSKGKSKLLIENEAIPGTFLKEEISVCPDKEKIRAALESGESIPGASLEEVYSLRKYPNRAKK